MAKPKQPSKNNGEFYDWEMQLYSGLEQRLMELSPDFENFAYTILTDDADFFKLEPFEVACNAGKLYDALEKDPQWFELMDRQIDFVGDKTYSKVVNSEFKKVIKKIVQIRNSAVKDYTKQLEENTLYGQTDRFADSGDYENYLKAMNLRRNHGKATIEWIIQNKMSTESGEIDRFRQMLMNIVEINLEPAQFKKFWEKIIDEQKTVSDALQGVRYVKQPPAEMPKSEPTKQSKIWDAFQAIYNTLYGPIVVNDDLASKLGCLECRFGECVSEFPHDVCFDKMLHKDLDEKIPEIYHLIDNVDKLNHEEELLLCRYSIYIQRIRVYNHDPSLITRYNRLESDLPKKRIIEIIKKYSNPKPLDTPTGIKIPPERDPDTPPAY